METKTASMPNEMVIDQTIQAGFSLITCRERLSNKRPCEGCVCGDGDCSALEGLFGPCDAENRSDETDVIFVAETTAPPCKHDTGKLRHDLVPAEWVEALAEVMTHGVKEYAPESWRGVEPHRYVAALMRHFCAHRRGEKLDPDSGLDHLKHVMANAAIILSLTNTNNG